MEQSRGHYTETPEKRLRKYLIYGTEGNDDMYFKLETILDKQHRQSTEKEKRELDKTKEDIAFIEEANRLMTELFNEHRLPIPEPLKPEQVHILDNEQFRLKFGSEAATTDAYAELVLHAIYIKHHLSFEDIAVNFDIDDQTEQRFDENEEDIFNEADDAYREEFDREVPEIEYDLPEDQWNDEQQTYWEFFHRYTDKRYEEISNEIKAEEAEENQMVTAFARYSKFGTFFHENLHLATPKSFSYDNETGHLFLAKGGYLSVSSSHEINSDGPHDYHFSSFNEAVTQKIVEETLVKDSVQKLLGQEMSYKAAKSSLWSEEIYKWDVHTLEQIISIAAERNGKNPEDVWLKIKHGYLTGEMMHLRELERSFGNGFLRVFSSLEAGRNKTLILFDQYLKTTNTAEREELGAEIIRKNKNNNFKRHLLKKYRSRISKQ